MAHQPRIHRGTVYGAKHQRGMTLPAISPQRNPTPEQRTAPASAREDLTRNIRRRGPTPWRSSSPV